MRTANGRSDNSQRVKKPAKKKVPASIHIQKPWIDVGIVSMEYGQGNNYIEYGLFQDDRPPYEIHDIDPDAKNIWKNTNTACFAGLLARLHERNDTYNRMFYTIYLKTPAEKKKGLYYSPCSDILLSIEECIRWIQLTKECKLLPDYVDENLIEMFDTPIKTGPERINSPYAQKASGKGTVVFDLTDLTQAQLYLYISTLRNLREYPGFVRTALYLIDRCKMNFYAAYVFASYIAINTVGHHTIRAYRPYGAIKQEINSKNGGHGKAKTKLSDVEAVNADMSWMIGLQRFTKNPKEHDKNLVYKCTTSFQCNSIIDNISRIRNKIDIYEALDPDIVKAIMADKDTTSQKYVDKFLEKKPRIKYKEAAGEK